MEKKGKERRRILRGGEVERHLGESFTLKITTVDIASICREWRYGQVPFIPLVMANCDGLRDPHE